LADRRKRQLAAFEAVGQRLMPALSLLDVEDKVRCGGEAGVSVPPIGEAHAADIEEECVESDHESVTLRAFPALRNVDRTAAATAADVHKRTAVGRVLQLR
jgi:hypothetical protein